MSPLKKLASGGISDLLNPVDARYWDRVAGDYDGEIFDSLGSARSGILLKRLDEFSDKSAPAADAGCGVGKYLPALASRFASVDAYDLSARLLKEARYAARDFQSIRYFKRDFASRSAKFSPVRFALCTNVLIMPCDTTRAAVLRSLARLVVPGGHALILAPSVESSLLVHHRMTEWNIEDGMDHEDAIKATRTAASQAGRKLTRGLLPIDGVPTKHFLREEVILTLRKNGFETLRIDKVEYGWDTEFEGPPKWMRDPFPWDWLITAKRIL